MHPITKKIVSNITWGIFGSITYSLLRDQWRYRSLRGAVVVISGGSRGLGLVLAQEYAREGASVALLARDEDELRRAQNIIAFQVPDSLSFTQVCDCTKAHQVEKAIANILDKFGKIDIVVNNAGLISSAPIENTSRKDFSDSIDIHFWAPYNVIRYCLPHLQKGARIVNVSSIGGIVPIPHRAAYCTGKFALTGYSESLRSELVKRGIYVTTVSPGLMRTGSVDRAVFKGQVKKEYAFFSLAASMPLITTSAESAARKIVYATKTGKAELQISLSTRLASLMHAHFPGMTADLFALANKALPNPVDEPQRNIEGQFAHSWISPSVLTTLTQKAAERNNEQRPPGSL